MATTTYPNTPTLAQKIGWARLPEACIGDPALPFVRHDDEAGTFTYANLPAEPAELLTRLGVTVEQDEDNDWIASPPDDLIVFSVLGEGLLLTETDRESSYDDAVLVAAEAIWAQVVVLDCEPVDDGRRATVVVEDSTSELINEVYGAVPKVGDLVQLPDMTSGEPVVGVVLTCGDYEVRVRVVLGTVVTDDYTDEGDPDDEY